MRDVAAASVIVLIAVVPPTVRGQDAAPPAARVPPPVVTDEALARIRGALEHNQSPVLRESVPRFHAIVDAKEWLDLTPPPDEVRRSGGSGGGADLLALANAGIKELQDMHRDRQVRLIREQIARELEALNSAPETSGPDSRNSFCCVTIESCPWPPCAR
jgi:hypothetical protein